MPISAGLFALACLLSSMAGQLADAPDEAVPIRWVKVAELGITVLAQAVRPDG